MSIPTGSRVAIVGGGLAGSLLAILLGRQGHSVDLFERRPDPRRSGRGGGRSINLAISTRGIDALARAGLADRVLEQSVPMRGRMIHPVEGELTYQPYSPDGDLSINSVSRGGLNQLLIEAAEAESTVRVHFGQRCTGLGPDATTVRLTDAESGMTRAEEFDVVIGADGAYSEVRRHLQHRERFDYAQSYLEHGYKELTIPAGPRGGFLMEPNALHIWPRGGFMMIALPNRDGSFTCTCFWPYGGPNGFEALHSPEAVIAYFDEVFPDAAQLMPNLAREFFSNPTGSLVTVRCKPWHDGRVGLIGDAAHAVVPFYGQGANASFEDCTVLAECAREYAPDWESAFEQFEAQRKVHTDALADLAIENFVEMRDKTASPMFHLGKKLEHTLARTFPEAFVPLYSMVTFTRTPYADAVRRARTQWRVVKAVGVGAAAGLFLLTALAVRRRRRG